MTRTRIALPAAGALLIGAVVAAQLTRSGEPGGDWPMYSYSYAGTRYSPLTEIHPGNVASLQQAWSLQLTMPGGRRGGGPGGAPGGGPAGDIDPGILEASGSNPQVTPVVIDGVMYLPARGNQVLALEAHTGRELWRYRLPQGGTTARAVAYWPGEGDLGPRLLLTAGRTLVALDAATGQPAAGFGNNGFADTGLPWNGVPTIYRHVAILGTLVGELPVGPPGDTRAFDVRTGEPLWVFHTVPRPGEVGHETWLDEGWRGRSGTNVWAWYMTLDEERGILYMPVSGPSPNYYGGDRPGDNLFANSIVAVDAETGEYLWHFQTVRHDLWDSDLPNPPALVDIVQDGETIPALASVGKTGWMFILNRVTGEPIFGVEERPVPQGDVPGEWYSPTQPFPVKPAEPLSRVSFDPERDFVQAEDTSEQHVAECRALWDRSGGFWNEGPFTPFLFQEEGAPPRSTIQLPGGTGGVNWGGAAVDPTTGYVYVNAIDTSLVGWVERKRPGLNYGRGTDGSDQLYDRASVNGPGPYFSFSAPLRDADGRVLANLPCYRPPWSRLVAVDANTGEIVWRSTLGITPGLPEDRQLTGGAGSAGPTVTAGGLVLVGATNDRHFRAFDARTGEELWAIDVGATVNANPMTYRGRDGRQYIAFVANDRLLSYALR